MNLYLTLKAIHIIAVISWMVGLLYLPRLFVYHVESNGAEVAKTFKVMEKRLIKIIMNPAMIITWLTGLSILWISGLGSIFLCGCLLSFYLCLFSLVITVFYLNV